MHEKTIVLFDCGPLDARMTWENCDKTQRMRKRVLKFNNDQEGVPTHMYENCHGCSGVTGAGEATHITASNPRPERVAVITIDGVFGYV